MKTKTKTKASVKVSGSKSGNPRLASEFAIGVIFFVAVIIGGIFWYYNGIGKKQVDQLSQNQTTTISKQSAIEKVSENSGATKENCQSHYYDGEQQLESWLVSQDEDGIIIAIKKEDVAKLPTENSSLTSQGEDYTFKLVDPTEEVKAEIRDSSKEKPVNLTVRGYAEVCQQPPLLSLQPATTAFKK